MWDQTNRALRSTVTQARVLPIPLLLGLLQGCSAVSFGLGLIPDAPECATSALDNGSTAYGTAMNEHTTRQQMLNSVVAGHAQAELYKNKELRHKRITAHCYFGKFH